MIGGLTAIFSVLFGLKLTTTMYSTLLILHSIVRYVVLVLLIVLIARSLMGMLNKSAYGPTDNKVSLFTFIGTHIQLLLGLLLYFFGSPFVKFSGETMKDATTRYWTVEHITVMLIAVVLITIGRSSSKKLSDGVAKHRRLFIFNLIALVLIVAGIAMAGRGFFGVSGL